MLHSKSALLLAFGAAAGVLLTGCAQINDQLSTIGRTTPENAPPGYHLFNDGETAAKHNDYVSASQNFCDAAKVGHPQAKQKCIEYTFLAAAKSDPRQICAAKDFDSKAADMCSRINKSMFLAGQRGKIEKQVRAEAQEVINKKQVKKQIQQGGFGEFTAEEF